MNHHYLFFIEGDLKPSHSSIPVDSIVSVGTRAHLIPRTSLRTMGFVTSRGFHDTSKLLLDANRRPVFLYTQLMTSGKP